MAATGASDWRPAARHSLGPQLSDNGETIISLWPGDGQVRVEKDGVDVFDLIEKSAFG